LLCFPSSAAGHLLTDRIDDARQIGAEFVLKLLLNRGRE
jgi:hypothetical protein